MSHTTSPGPFAEAFAAALVDRGVSLTSLRDQLRDQGHSISLATLSYWRSGSREPERRASLEALAAAERLLGLQESALTRHLGRRNGAGVESFSTLLHRERSGVIEDLAQGEDDVDRLMFHLVADVPRPPEPVRLRLTHLYVARRDGVEGVSLFNGTIDDHDVDEPEFESFRPVSGCRIRSREDLGNGIEKVFVEFDRPLHQGEAVMTEIEVVGESDGDGDYMGLVAEQRLEEAMVWVRFPPGDIPARAWVSFAEGDVSHEWEVDLLGASGVHYRQTDFGPGDLMIRWEW